jgi:membrane protease YdiL (CAAX protease family)
MSRLNDEHEDMNLLKRIWAVTWRVALFIAGWGLLSAAFILPLANKFATPGRPLPVEFQLYIECVSLVTILLAAWGMLRFIDRRPFLSLGFTPRHAVRDSIIGLLIGLGMMTTCIAILYFCGWARPESGVGFSAFALALPAFAMIANTITQEVMVRGYVQQTIQSRFGLLSGVIASALFFLGLHLGAIQGAILPMISLFAAGVLLGTAYAVTGNLWLPIALHFGWNFLQGPVLGQLVSGQSLGAGWKLFQLVGPPLMTGGTFGVEGGLIAIIITILGTPLVLLIYRTHREAT